MVGPTPDPAVVDALVGRVGVAPSLLGRVRLVCVDGPAGSGKTTLAAALADRLGPAAHVVHLDDFYEGWTGLEGSLWPRLSAQVLDPLRAGRPGRFRRWDWLADGWDGWVDVPVPDVLVVEGCGSAQRAVDGSASLLVWVEAPDDLRLARGLARDGAAVREHWLAWMAAEARHFAAEGTADRADVRLDGWGRMPT